MKRTLIRYKTKPETADRNAELMAAVFAELKATRRKGSAICRCGSKTTVSCISSRSARCGSAMPKLKAFKAFQGGIRERCIEPPLPRGATMVGNYRMLNET